MVEEVFGVRDDGFDLLVVLLAIWRGATQALDRGKFSILLGVVVVHAEQGFNYHKKRSRSVSTGKALLLEGLKKLRVQERTRGIPCCGSTMGRAIFDPRLARLLWSME